MHASRAYDLQNFQGGALDPNIHAQRELMSPAVLADHVTLEDITATAADQAAALETLETAVDADGKLIHRQKSVVCPDAIARGVLVHALRSSRVLSQRGRRSAPSAVPPPRSPLSALPPIEPEPPLCCPNSFEPFDRLTVRFMSDCMNGLMDHATQHDFEAAESASDLDGDGSLNLTEVLHGLRVLDEHEEFTDAQLRECVKYCCTVLAAELNCTVALS